MRTCFSNKMKAKFSPAVQKKLIAIQHRDKKLFEKIQKQTQLFQSNPQHPSLRLHKLSGNYSNVWSYISYHESTYGLHTA